MSKMNAMAAGGIAFVAAGIMLAAPAFAQNASQEVMKQCGEKWQTAKTANTTGNQTWPQFLSKCRTESAQKPAATPASATAPAAATAPAVVPATTTAQAQTPAAKPPAAAAPATAKPPAAAAPATAKPAAPAAAKPTPTNAVFPARIDPKYAKEKPGAQRQKTCLDQYNANKAASAGAGNGGLNWIQKGGGYYSECNKRLGGGTGA